MLSYAPLLLHMLTLYLEYFVIFLPLNCTFSSIVICSTLYYNFFAQVCISYQMLSCLSEKTVSLWKTLDLCLWGYKDGWVDDR